MICLVGLTTAKSDVSETKQTRVKGHMVHQRTHVAVSVHDQQLRAWLYSWPAKEVCMLAVISWVYHTCSRAKLSNNGSKTRTFMVRPLDVVDQNIYTF